MRFFILVLTFTITAAGILCAADKDTQKNTTQQIGGLLFDVDEGVKVEQGPGGSVYVKSNREYMQQKFEEIEDKLIDLEARVEKLEEGNASLPNPAESPAENRKVFVA